ncbi:hypothetical protein DSN97_05220 [Deferribacteraceae bacterium V6Fe1]|nr:hypothetical protein DSN97_05220 [Deferribacteraceae bacterium V6Fe1]
MSKSITNKYLESLSPKEKLYRISIQENLFLEIRPNCFFCKVILLITIQIT